MTPVSICVSLFLAFLPCVCWTCSSSRSSCTAAVHDMIQATDCTWYTMCSCILHGISLYSYPSLLATPFLLVLQITASATSRSGNSSNRVGCTLYVQASMHPKLCVIFLCDYPVVLRTYVFDYLSPPCSVRPGVGRTEAAVRRAPAPFQAIHLHRLAQTRAPGTKCLDHWVEKCMLHIHPVRHS